MTSRTLRKLQSFSRLEVGWHYGSGGPISSGVLVSAIDLLRFYTLLGLTRNDAFAGQNGEVLLTAYRDDEYIASMLEPDGKIAVSYEKNGADLFHDEVDSLKQAKLSVARIARGLQATAITNES